MRLKGVLLFLFLISVVSISTASASDVVDVQSVDSFVDLEEQYEMLREYRLEWNKKRSSVTSQINMIGFKGEDGIDIGLSDLNDEYLKNEILSLPGIDPEKIEFVDFEVEWYGFGESVPDDFEGEVVELFSEEDNPTPRKNYFMG